jgi:hypothetical protein
MNHSDLNKTCVHCVHFQNDPALLEGAFPGLTAMSSGYASVRAQDGLCRLHGIYLCAWDRCPHFVSRAMPDHAYGGLQARPI